MPGIAVVFLEDLTPFCNRTWLEPRRCVHAARGGELMTSSICPVSHVGKPFTKGRFQAEGQASAERAYGWQAGPDSAAVGRPRRGTHRGAPRPSFRAGVTTRGLDALRRRTRSRGLRS